MNRAPIASAVQSYLAAVREAVKNVPTPAGERVDIPDFDAIHEAAGRLDTSPDPNGVMWVTNSLLGRAASVDLDVPGASYKVAFPRDHHLHPTMGTEWYWIGCHMNVTDQNGRKGRLSLLQSMQKIRIVGLAAQRAAGWTDKQVTLATDIVTVTVDMGPADRSYHRRSRILQCPLTGGVVDFSVPGEDFFFQCGPDSLKGSAQVLPLALKVADGTHMNVDISFTHNDSTDLAKSFFLQGVPTGGIAGGGTGVTPIPQPGVYYSWPQLVVSGVITIDGTTYTINSGSAWIDHQLLMTSLENPNGAVTPIPFVQDPRPYKGWTWQFYNLDNGQAFTGAAFVNGEMNLHPKMAYGYFLAPKNRGWAAIFINGENDLLSVNSFPSIAGGSTRERSNVDIPVARTYRHVENVFVGHPLSGVAIPWYSDGTFNNPNWGICAEMPADYTDLTGKYSNGVGYLETVGFEAVEAWRKFALSYLRNPGDGVDAGASPTPASFATSRPATAGAPTVR